MILRALGWIVCWFITISLLELLHGVATGLHLLPHPGEGVMGPFDWVLVVISVPMAIALYRALRRRWSRGHVDTGKLERGALDLNSAIKGGAEPPGGNMISKITGAISSVLGGVGAIALYIGLCVGWLYWVYVGVKLGSFVMVIIALLGPVGLIVSVLGLWSFIFGAPAWIVHLFT